MSHLTRLLKSAQRENAIHDAQVCVSEAAEKLMSSIQAMIEDKPKPVRLKVVHKK
jgi:hypothetical protein